MKTTKQGFSAVEIVLVLAVVVVVGFIGYTVAQNTIFKDSTLDNVNMSETATDVPTVPEINESSDLNEITETINGINLDDDSGDISELETQLSEF